MVAFQPGFLNPVHAARMSATLQRVSGGRLVYNVITGGGGPAQRWWGDSTAHDDRYARTTEFLDVLKGVWDGGPFDYDGRFYQVATAGSPSSSPASPSPTSTTRARPTRRSSRPAGTPTTTSRGSSTPTT